MKHIYDPPQHRRYILPRRLLIPLLFLACLAEIGLTAPATNLPLLYTSFPYHTEDLLWTLVLPRSPRSTAGGSLGPYSSRRYLQFDLGFLHNNFSVWIFFS